MGTVKGDLHDIGKNLVTMMLEGAGFKVVDLGVDVKIDDLIETLKREKADILGLSALLTTTMPEMQKVIETLQSEGLRDQVKVLVGGAPIDRNLPNKSERTAMARMRSKRFNWPANWWLPSDSRSEFSAPIGIIQ